MFYPNESIRFDLIEHLQIERRKKQIYKNSKRSAKKQRLVKVIKEKQANKKLSLRNKVLNDMFIKSIKSKK